MGHRRRRAAAGGLRRWFRVGGHRGVELGGAVRAEPCSQRRGKEEVGSSDVDKGDEKFSEWCGYRLHKDDENLEQLTTRRGFWDAVEILFGEVGRQHDFR